MMRRTRSHYFEGSRPRVEVIPMIDIMMFLLVFFVVISLKMIAGTGVAMELPGSATTQEIKTSTITVGVAKSGETVLDGKTRHAGRIAHTPHGAEAGAQGRGGPGRRPRRLAADAADGDGHGAKCRHHNRGHCGESREKKSSSVQA